MLSLRWPKHGILGPWSPFVHPLRWWSAVQSHKRACEAHEKTGRIHAYVLRQWRLKLTDSEATWVAYHATERAMDETWKWFDRCCDWMALW